MTTTLSWAQARRIALRSQGMGPARRSVTPGARASRLALERTLARTQLLQIDSVNVFARAHHLPVFTRTGAWDPAVLDAASRPGPQRLVREDLAHEAAFTTAEVHRLLAFRRRRAATDDWEVVRRAVRESPDLFPQIRSTLAEHGPLSAAAISRHLGDTRRGSGWGWRRTPSQWAVEYLFRSGALDCVGRTTQFERLYLPAEHPDPPSPEASAPIWPQRPDQAERAHSSQKTSQETPPLAEDEAVRRLAALAARALGVADPAAIADYFRLRIRQVRPALADLVAAGELQEVEVDHPRGRSPMLLHREAPDATPLRTTALVSPFDPIVFFRPRLQALFDVDYRIGIYTPAARRTTGYYSLLYLHGDRIPARVDLKADREAGVLRVRGAYREELPSMPGRRGLEDDTVGPALLGELRRAARWQGLEEIAVDIGPGTGEISALLADGGGDVGLAAP